MTRTDKPEILAPAGSSESLLAAVRCGADAVYLGGKTFNARKNAANFDGGELKDAVRYCHERGVKVYLALNTLVSDSELDEAADLIKTACETAIDALIVQDSGVMAIAREVSPDLPLHASTQMSIYNLEGAKKLEELGFSRVVLARELSMAEIAEIGQNTSIELECFVHGALCMSVSGQCYFSAFLGSRSGNRGLCAQPCRLPFKSQGRENCLSLKDLSLIENIPDMLKAGVTSLKIEGRMKRPEYVAAAVSAVKMRINGETPDLGALESVFSRGGFTDGYFAARTGADMFGIRSREDVAAASPALLSSIAASFRNETRLVPVDMELTIKANEDAALVCGDGLGNVATAKSGPPQTAKTSPTTCEKAFAALTKTGGTPFFVRDFAARIDEGLMLPASALNTLRREALDELLKLRGEREPHGFTIKPDMFKFAAHESVGTEIRVRIGKAEQLSREIAETAQLLLIPALELERLDDSFLTEFAGKIAVEAPRILFGQKNQEKLKRLIGFARQKGITRAVAGNLGSIGLLKDAGFAVSGDFSLNVTNTLAIGEYAKLGLEDVTVSFELAKNHIAGLGGKTPRGILAYGHLPLMATRNCPAGSCKNCVNPVITDRLGNKFPVRCGFGVSEILNCVPLILSDRLAQFSFCDFITLYYTIESPRACGEILRLYQGGGEYSGAKTRGPYYRGVD